VQRAKETQIHIDRIRTILLDPRTWQHTLDRVKKSMSATPKTKSVRREEEREEEARRQKAQWLRGVVIIARDERRPYFWFYCVV